MNICIEKLFCRSFSSLVQRMNKVFSKIYIILTLDYIVVHYCLLDTTSFTYAEDNFISYQLVWQKADCYKPHSTTKALS